MNTAEPGKKVNFCLFVSSVRGDIRGGGRVKVMRKIEFLQQLIQLASLLPSSQAC